MHKIILLEELIGPAWAECWFNADLLVIPGWKQGFTPQELRSMWYDCQEVYRARAYRQMAEQEQDRLQQQISKAEADRDWYRQQLALESHMGLMLLNLVTP